MSAELTLLDPDDRIHNPKLLPAPWTVHGACWVLLLKSGELGDEALFVPPTLRGKRHGQTLSLVFFDYRASPCGPYRELLIGAAFDFADGQYSSITRAYASTHDSVANIRRNWGVPADHADFSIEHPSDARERVVVTRAGRAVAELELEQFGFALPVTTAVLPADLRTMVQHWHGREYRLTLQAKGKVRMAKLRSSRFASEFFPDVSRSSVIASAYLPHFELKLSAVSPRDL